MTPNGAAVADIAGNAAYLSTVAAVFDALQINQTTAPAFTIGRITRPELHFNESGHIILDTAASAFAGAIRHRIPVSRPAAGNAVSARGFPRLIRRGRAASFRSMENDWGSLRLAAVRPMRHDPARETDRLE